MNQQIKDIVAELHARTADWPQRAQDQFFSTVWDGSDLSEYHMTLGMHIRNNYNLWTIPWEPELRNGVDYSPYHPDQLSYTIMEEVWKLGPCNAKSLA